MKGANYCVCQGVYSPQPLSKTPAGFYLRVGSEQLVHCTWVEWWIPTPNNPA